MLSCAVCNTEVKQLTDGTLTRDCEHVDAPVNASLTATVYGEGGACGLR